MKTFVILCLLAIFLTLSGATDCPDLWIPFQGSCYLFSHQNYSFVEAQHYCQVHHGGHLVHLESPDENNFVKDHISYMAVTDKRWWIGLTDENVEGLWVWTGSDKKPEFSDWAPNEPNGGHHESCGEIFNYQSKQLSWNDAECNTYKPLICEKTPGNLEVVG